MHQSVPQRSKIAGLDHLRALAITLVFMFHYRLFEHPAWVDMIGSFGWTGVDLFFVLSGYLIAGQIFKGLKSGTFSLSEFFLKRFFRILPAYWTVLALYFLVPAFREWESLPPLWKFLSFTQNFGLDLRTQRTFSHAWSLCIEEQFYLLLPFTLLFLHHFKASRKAGWLLLFLCCSGFAARIFSWNHFMVPAMDTDAFGALWYKWLYYPTYNRLDGLLAGIGIAAVFHYSEKPKRFMERNANLLLAAGLMLIACAYMLCEVPSSFGASVFGYPLIALAFGLMVAACICPDSIANRLSSRVTARIATLSYAIYLTHKAAIHFTQEQVVNIHLKADGNTTFLISIAISVFAAAVLHYSIERPFLKLKEHIINRRKSTGNA